MLVRRRRCPARLRAGHLDKLEPRGRRNLDYVAQLVALRAWYRRVRLARIPAGPEHDPVRIPVRAALESLDAAVDERVERARSFAAERGHALEGLDLQADAECPLGLDHQPELDHVAWVRSRSDEEVARGIAWLQGIVDRVLAGAGH